MFSTTSFHLSLHKAGVLQIIVMFIVLMLVFLYESLSPLLLLTVNTIPVKHANINTGCSPLKQMHRLKVYFISYSIWALNLLGLVICSVFVNELHFIGYRFQPNNFMLFDKLPNIAPTISRTSCKFCMKRYPVGVVFPALVWCRNKHSVHNAFKSFSFQIIIIRNYIFQKEY